ncbi:MAG: precorrin-3B C(17)-methyltransferase [Candidatus Caldatribacteriaceae bacterium]
MHMVWIKVVGTGPGSTAELTRRAAIALREAQVVLGYGGYLRRLGDFLKGKNVFSFAMGEEVQRCRETVRMAEEGWKAVLISGGDPGIYGMASLLLEVALPEGMAEHVEVIPGVSAMNAASAVLGAPLSGDFAVVSLSDYLLPWEEIAERLEILAQTDLVLVLYNPGSSLRPHIFPQAVTILRRYRPPETPVGIVRKVSLPEQTAMVTTLQEVEKHPVDMHTIVIVGNRKTFQTASLMITPRGYRL